MSVTTADTSIEAQAPAVEATSTATVPARAADHGWVWQVTLLSAAMGAMLALAINTTRRIRDQGLPGIRFGASASMLANYQEQNTKLQTEIKKLNGQVNDLQQSINTGSSATQLLQGQLQEIKLRAGLAPVEGPGLKVILHDSQEKLPKNLPPEDYDGLLIHDQDLNGVINELKAAGAEALAMSGADPRNMQRIVVTTTVRCVGPNVIINGTQLSGPYTIYAIGDPKDLRGALELPNGFIQQSRLGVLKMIQIEEADHLVLPQYSGAYTPRYAKPAPENP